MMNGESETITFDDFMAVDIRAGEIVAVEPFPEARKPAWKLQVDFGPELGTRWTSAQITDLYDKEDLLGRVVLAVVNFPSKRIAGFKSEVLVLGINNGHDQVVLLQPERRVPLGQRVY